ncbi:PAQR family membrane homeostasis protein TrhA [Alkalibacter mobilis]|uniref:PAQR family membrane homeostasis protein TrhA n=1 Tax=Alkalibacter mobilis TaxID=2787712 RepID=UPI0018A0C342|nr:hemolysin III family protein [Alkalibacter mobilis]MBF7096962.1 hemolysin III family protein [Alkalibacter mobilis]
MKIIIREPINTITHFAGFVLSIIGFIYLMIKSIMDFNSLNILSTVIFSAGLIGLYFASFYYHGKIAEEKILVRLRKLDHVMIFFLIAATYTPVCLITLQGQIGYILLGIIWGLAIVGMIIKMFFINVPRWISTGLYLFLGWASISVIKPLFSKMPLPGFLLLVAGGLFYTFGAIIYGTKSEKIRVANFGYHEIFHIFILLGSLSHYLMVSLFIIK